MSPPRRAPAGDDAALVGLGARARRRIDCDDDLSVFRRRRIRRQALALEQRPRPQGARRLLDDLGVKLLPPERATFERAAIRSTKASARKRELSKVEPRVTTAFASPSSRLMSLVGRGVVVMTACGLSPSLRPSIA